MLGALDSPSALLAGMVQQGFRAGCLFKGVAGSFRPAQLSSLRGPTVRYSQQLLEDMPLFPLINMITLAALAP